MKDILILTLKLFIITLVAAALLGATYGITKEPIAEQELQAANEARTTVLSDAADFQIVEGLDFSGDYANIKEVYKGMNDAGECIGATVLISAKGYKPGISLTVGILSDGTVSAISIGSHDETPGLGAKATLPEFYEQFSNQKAPLSVVKNTTPGDSEILAISGATKTTAGITNAVNTAVEFYNEFIAE